MKLKWIINTTAIALLIFVAFLGLAQNDAAIAAQEEGNKIEGMLLDQFSADGAADFIVRFTEQADLSAANGMDWTAKGEYVYNTLRNTAANSQVNAIGILENAGYKYQTFIGGNDLYVWGGTLAVANEVAALPEVSFIRATRMYYIDPVSVEKPFDKISWAGDLLASKALTTVQGSTDATLAWGIDDVNANDVWALGARGAGIKVANIDTGVQWNHPALVNQFACPGNPSDPACWADPSNICGGSACDNNGHGTHTMGTMAALDDPGLTYIAGMAPDATWIACKGCESTSCSDFALTSCADWILAPGGNPSNRPHVVNNSWGGGGGDAWYQTYVQNWATAGVFPAFSAGNSSGCGSMGSPGDYQVSFASTGHDVNRNHAWAQGPSAFGHTPYTKPNITAPSISVCSTVPTNGWSCGYSGTSMASPHSAGAVALVWSGCPDYIGDVDGTFQLLQNNTDAPNPNPPGCGVPPDGEGTYEDGYGYLNALSVVNACIGGVEFGTLEGHVYDQFDNPVEGANVSAVPGVQGNQVQATTDPNGYYTMQLVSGTWDVTASKTNYTSQTVTGVVVNTGQTTVQDFAIDFQGAWTQIALPPSCPDWTRIDAEYFNATGKAYILGGRGGTDGGSTFGDIYSFDPFTETCADTGANMPTPVSNYTIVPLNDGTADLLCTFGGRDSAGGMTLAVQCYNPVSNAVVTKANLPSTFTGFLPGGAVAVNGKAYLFGGFRSTSAPYNHAYTYEYDPIANNYTQKGDLSLGRGYIDVAVVDGLIYGFGGDTFDGTNLVAQTRTEVYDPAAGTWDDAAVAELATASGEGRAYGFGAMSEYELAGKIVIAGGGQWPENTNEVIIYDIASDTFDTAFPNLNTSRRNHAGFFVPGDPGAMWVFGGRSGADTPPYSPPEFYEVAVTTQAPIIRVEPTSLATTVLTGETSTELLTIFNDGNADLTWELYDGVLDPSWIDNFDSYDTGSQMHGQGGWKGWFNDPAAGALTSDLFSLSAPNSVAITAASDLVHEYGNTDGSWVFSAWQYIPLDFTGTSYFILLNSYDDGGVNLNWSTEVSFDSATDTLSNDGPAGGSLPITYGDWVEIRVEIDLDADTQEFYYGGALLFQDSWSEGMSGGGVTTIQAVDLFANGASPVYYDDISLAPAADPACGVYGDVAWLSTDPTNGTTLPGEGSDVDVMFDASGLDVGLYEATLCAESNDSVTPLVPIPVSMSVVENARVAVAHLAPFAMDPGTAVTITLNGIPALTDFAFADSTGYIDLLPGEYLVEVWPMGAPEPAITATVDLAGGTDYSVVAIGDGVNQPLELMALVDDNTPPAAGKFHLRLGHLAPFAATGTEADICLQDGTPVLTDVPYGAVASYLPLDAGTYDLVIAVAGTDCGEVLIDPLPVTFVEGQILTAFAVGNGTLQPLGVFAWPSDQVGFLLPLMEGYSIYLPLIMK